MRYCWRYGKLGESMDESLVCLRLNSLSLARNGSMENLLWVRMLDLSCNGLGSLEGNYVPLTLTEFFVFE